METIEIYNKQGGWPKISTTIEVIEPFHMINTRMIPWSLP